MSEDKKRRDPHVFDDSKLRLYTANPLQGANKPASIQIKLIENNPCISVDYGKLDQKERRITHDTPIDPQVFNMMLTMIRYAAKSKQPVAFELDNWGHPFIWNKDLGKNERSKDRMNLSRVTVGRNDVGYVFIRYSSYKKDDVEVTFGETDYHKLLQNGNPMPPALASSIAAESWATLMGEVYNVYFATKWEEPEWRKAFRAQQAAKFSGGGNGQRQGGGNGGGYSGNRNGGGGGYNNNGGNSGGGYSGNNGGQRQSAPEVEQSDDDFSFDM